jgi:hypothetical protein
MENDKQDEKQALLNTQEEFASDLRPFLQNITLKTVQLGQVALELYAKGELHHAAIVPLCEELLAAEKTLLLPPTPLPAPPAETVAPIEPIEAVEVVAFVEAAEEEATAVSPPALSPPPTIETPAPTAPVLTDEAAHCPQCQSPVAPGKKFCTTCGFRLIPADPPPPPIIPEAPAPMPEISLTTPPAALPETPAPDPTPPDLTNEQCPTCGAELVEGAAFCIGCGQPLGSTPPLPVEPLPSPPPMPGSFAPPPVGPIAKYCQNCGKGVTEETAVCSECGSTEFDPA